METPAIVIIVILVMFVITIGTVFLLSKFKFNKLIGSNTLITLLQMIETDLNYIHVHFRNEYDNVLEQMRTRRGMAHRFTRHIAELLSIRNYITTGDARTLRPNIREYQLYETLHNLSIRSPTGQMYCRLVTNYLPEIAEVPTFKSKFIVSRGKPYNAHKFNFTIRCKPPRLAPYSEAEKRELLKPINNHIDSHHQRMDMIRMAIDNYINRNNIQPPAAPNFGIVCRDATLLFPGIDLPIKFTYEDYEFYVDTNNLSKDYISAIFDDINVNRGNPNPQFHQNTLNFINRIRARNQNFANNDFHYLRLGNINSIFRFLFDAILYHAYVNDLHRYWDANGGRRLVQPLYPPTVTNDGPLPTPPPPISTNVLLPLPPPPMILPQIITPPLVEEDVNYSLIEIMIVHRIHCNRVEASMLLTSSPSSVIDAGETSVSSTSGPTDSPFSRAARSRQQPTNSPNVSTINLYETFHELFQRRNLTGISNLIDRINDIERQRGLKLSHPFDYLIPRNNINDEFVCTIGVDNEGQLCLKNNHNIIPFSCWRQIQQNNIVYHDEYRTLGFNISFHPNYVYSIEPKIITPFRYVDAIEGIDRRFLINYLLLESFDEDEDDSS